MPLKFIIAFGSVTGNELGHLQIVIEYSNIILFMLSDSRRQSRTYKFFFSGSVQIKNMIIVILFDTIQNLSFGIFVKNMTKTKFITTLITIIITILNICISVEDILG